jgi:FkbM family methyltransferase
MNKLPQVNIIRAQEGDYLSFFDKRGISAVLTAHGTWDPVSIALAKALVDIQPSPPIILDIGANMGTFTIPLAKHIGERGGYLHAFEPQRIVYYQLCGNVFLNRLNNVYVHQVAIGNQTKMCSIPALDFGEAWNIGAYSLVEGRDSQLKSTLQDSCAFQKLDDIKFHDKISLLKVDTEGMELDVFRGANNLLQASGFPPILFEFWEGDKEIFKLLSSLGYDCKQYGNEDWLAQNVTFATEIDFNLEGGQLNLIRKR